MKINRTHEETLNDLNRRASLTFLSGEENSNNLPNEFENLFTLNTIDPLLNECVMEENELIQPELSFQNSSESNRSSNRESLDDLTSLTNESMR